VTTPDDPTAVEPPADEEAPPPPPRRGRSLGLETIERYLPIVAVAGMIATYLQVQNAYDALILIAGVWLIATRIAKSRRFLGLTLTEALAWDATVLIFLVLIFNFLFAAQQPTA
jgi:hypothetical protein